MPFATRIRRASFVALVLSFGRPADGSAQAALTLADLAQRVVATHPALAAANARIRAAEGNRRAMGTLPNPIASYQYDYTETAAGGLERETMATATLPLEFIYQQRARVRMADAGVRGAAAEASAERQRVLIVATRAYYRVATAQASVAAGVDLLAWLDSLVVYDRARVAEGAVAEADLLRTRIERDRAAVELTMRQVELARAHAELVAVMGTPVTTRVLPPEGPLRTPSGLDDLVGGSQRPELRAASERVAALSAGVRVEQRLILRELGVMVGLQRMGGTSSVVGGVTVPLPLFDRNRGSVIRASAERDAAELDLAAQRRSADAELAGEREATRLLTARALELTDTADGGTYLKRADDARRIALGAYREGALPLFQLLDAARAWGEARITFFEAIYAQHQAVIALADAAGTDLATLLPALVAYHPSGKDPR